MIIKYNDYILENYDNCDLDFYIKEAISELNTIYSENRFSYNKTSTMYNYYSITFKYNSDTENILYIFKEAKHIRLSTEKLYIDVNEFRSFYIGYNENIKELIKQKSITCVILTYLKLWNVNFSFNMINNIEYIIDTIINSNIINIAIRIIENNYLPKYLIDKYNYLLHANNFDIL